MSDTENKTENRKQSCLVNDWQKNKDFLQSETHNNIQYQNANGENLLENKYQTEKKMTTDTDYYFNLIANPAKLSTIKNKTSSESSELRNIINSHNITSDSDNSSRKSNVSTISSRKSKNISDSKPIYEKVNVNPISFMNTKTQSSNNLNIHKNMQENIPASIPSIHASIHASIPEVRLTTQEIRMRKIELLRKLCEIKLKGYQLSKEYDFNSSLEEMEYEYALLKSFADKRNGVKIFRSGFLQVVSVIEFLNDKYDPFDFHLSGWNEHLQIEIDSWEDVLEEIYEKYKGSGKKMAPEIKLLYLIIASASAFHFTKAHASKLPGLDTMLASNPGLISKIINPGKQEKSQFMTAQEINIEKQKAEFKKRDLERKQPSVQTHVQQPASNIPEIRAPSQVKDILNIIHNLKPSHETQEETSNNYRIVSESKISELN